MSPPRRSSAARAALGAAILAATSGCAAPRPLAATAPARAPSATQASEDEWTPLSWEDRHDLMTWAVLPNMGRVFWKFEGKAAPEMSCRTCHGKDAEAVAYKMPNGLPALDPAHMPSATSANAKEARMVTFMQDEVVPKMRDLLGAPQLSCFTCHPGVK
jgi:hypothetical protein